MSALTMNMEGQQLSTREKPRPPYQRTASRSSTSTRMTSQSGNSSTSHLSSSPQLHPAHPVHRYHHASCSKPPASPKLNNKVAPRLSRAGSIESGRQTPVSAFLQERLEKERQAEGQKNAASISALPRSYSDMSASLELGSVGQRSPTKSIGPDARPQTTTGTDPKKKGLALKEMEQVVSGLHKQNFDLKLELYHRRERQTALEERMEALETEKAQVEEMNDKLIGEMEKRDKAVEEAVAMIVTLEAKIDELTKEREMVRHVEAGGFYGSPGYEPRLENASPQPANLDVPRWEDDAKSLNRMPSFVSDRTEKTENLRNVYLGARGSVVSLPRVTEGSQDVDNGPANGLVSPTVSILSESSFVSVYGQKSRRNMTPSRNDAPLALDLGVGKDGASDVQGTPNGRSEVSAQLPRSNSVTRANGMGQFQPIAGIMGGSPLQRIEKLGPAYAQASPKKDSPRSVSSGRRSTASVAEKGSKPTRKATREEKREALRKVMTDHPGGVSLHDQNLPPTPDTIGSSTLHRFKNSNDNLERKPENAEARSEGNLSQVQNVNERLPEAHTGVSLETQPPTARSRRAPEASNYRTQHNPASIQRPRSADESTVSHRRGTRWDEDAESDTDSFDSSLDIWLRAGQKGGRNGGKASPDLFGFPTSPSRGSWAMNAMFGPNSVYTGGANMEPNNDQMRDLFSAQEALFGSTPEQHPEPPHRWSSLNAQTGTNLTPRAEGKGEVARSSPLKERVQKGQKRLHRHFRRNSDDAQLRAAMKTPVPGQFSQPPQQSANGEQKRNHYPPITGHQGARHGLSRLLRRSLGGGTPSSPIADNVTSATVLANTDTTQDASSTGVPIWVSRSSAIEDDRSGATPPPILMNPHQGGAYIPDMGAKRLSMPGMETVYSPEYSDATTAKGAHSSAQVAREQQPESGQAGGSATGSRRKWLPAFGRASSLKNKGG